ncbi:site-specific recombinase XerD [Candidatus Nitrososphaera evergladensis SR1]|uniref:Site-specific recombinase XerD n=1 Tax=Candidatus Nitrososphaera evergladensis SR1 TaxID=1459636 RepID=A0A075MQM0_9ARCH|nr:tyrosine-type recombinase/integrase [Candidatus Nitrososphaera evergladensis]AIF83831.1 site-specific recombinase XerD [Candidatus Nitrososphaera evergladensis SR1]
MAKEYLGNVSARNAFSGRTYAQRIKRFEEFVAKDGIDATVAKLLKGKLDVYKVMSGFNAYMASRKVTPRSQVQTVKTVRNFLEYCDVPISKAKFKLKVFLPVIVRKQKKALSKAEVREIVMACRGDARLFTYVLFLAATGCRATEALNVRNKDLHLDDPIQPYVFIRGETTKTKQDRNVFLTTELIKALKEYLTVKYRERRTVYDRTLGKTIHNKFAPRQEDDDYVFVAYHQDRTIQPDLRSVYVHLNHAFVETLDRNGRGQKEENKRRRKITFHSLRRFVKTQISTLGYAEFSEYFIGHTSTVNMVYFAETHEKLVQIFKKCEPALTLLDVTSMEARQRDFETRLQKAEQEALDAKNSTAQMEQIIANMARLKGYKWTRDEFHQVFKGLLGEPEEEERADSS